MPDGSDYLMRPILEGMTLYETLSDGNLLLEDYARMNDVLDVRAENERRAFAAIEAKKDKR